MGFRLGDTWKTPERQLSAVTLEVRLKHICGGRAATYLEVCARACLDIVWSKPLPHLHQSQAFRLIHIEHSLVKGEWEKRRGQTDLVMSHRKKMEK